MEIITKINWVDVLVIILILRISYIAFQEGLSHEIFPLIGGILMLIFSLHYYERIGLFLSENLINIPIVVANFLSYLLLVVIIGLAFKLVKALLDKIIKVEWHPLIERFGGLVCGVMRGYVAASLVLMVIALAPLPYLQWSIRDKSLTGVYFLKAGSNIYAKVSGFLPTLKVEGPSIDKDAILNKIVQDKSIVPKTDKKRQKTHEWEK